MHIKTFLSFDLVKSTLYHFLFAIIPPIETCERVPVKVRFEDDDLWILRIGIFIVPLFWQSFLGKCYPRDGTIRTKGGLSVGTSGI